MKSAQFLVKATIILCLRKAKMATLSLEVTNLCAERLEVSKGFAVILVTSKLPLKMLPTFSYCRHVVKNEMQKSQY